MTRRADFKGDEWAIVVEAPPLAALMVMAADRGGTLRESATLAQAYADARQRQGISELFDDLVAANPQLQPGRFRSQEDIRAQAPRRLREAVAILERVAQPDEVDGYRRFVTTLADAIAHAHKEGGVLGIGGKPVSDREQAALDEITAALGGDGGS